MVNQFTINKSTVFALTNQDRYKKIALHTSLGLPVNLLAGLHCDVRIVWRVIVCLMNLTSPVIDQRKTSKGE